MPPVRRQISKHAAPLRRNMTDVEKALWAELRSRRLGGLKFKRQWTIGRYVADFCCLERRLIVEADGGQHSEERDAARTAFLQSEGYRVLRFWNNEVIENMDGVLQRIVSEACGAEDPHPSPLPLAGEGAE